MLGATTLLTSKGEQMAEPSAQKGQQKGRTKLDDAGADGAPAFAEMAKKAAEMANKAAKRQQERVEASTVIRLKYLFDLQKIDAELQAARRQAGTSFAKRLESAHQQRLEQERGAYEEYLEKLGGDDDDGEERLYDASLKVGRRQLDAAHQEQLAYRDAQSEYLTALREAEASAQEKAWQGAAEHLKQLLEVGP